MAEKTLENWSRRAPTEAGAEIQRMVDGHERNPGWRHRMAARGANAYSALGHGELFEGLSTADQPWGGTKRKRKNGGWGDKAQEQWARSIAETVAEKITGLVEPKSQMVGTDLEWEKRRQGVWADRFNEGNYHQQQGMYLDTWDLARHGFLLAAVATGCVAARTEPDYVSKRVRTQLRSTLNTFIDPGDVANGQPLTFVDVTWENPEYLIEDDRFKTHRDKIMAAACVPPHHSGGRLDGASFATKMVKLVTAWRMPFGSFKGRHAAFIGGTAPIWEDWEFPEPPLAFFRINRCLDPNAFWGENFIEIMLDPLRDAEDIDDLVKQTMSRTSQTNIGIDGTTTGPAAFLNAKDVNVFKFDSNKGEKPPNIQKPEILHAQYFEHRNRKIDVAKQLAGVPDLHISSQSSAPSSSGRSKRLEASLLPERFAKKLRNWQHWVAVDIAKNNIRAARAIGKVEPDWQVTWPGADFDSKVSVEVLDIDDSIYELRPYPVSEQKNTPAALAADAQEMFDRQEITKETLSVILNGVYDTKKESKQGESQRRLVAKVLDDIMHCDPEEIDDENRYMAERYMPPDPWMDAPSALAQAVPIYRNAMVDGLPQNRRAMLRRFLEDLTMLGMKAQRQTAMQGADVSVEATPEQAFPVGPAGAAPPPVDAGLGAPAAAPPGGMPAPGPMGLPN